MFLHRARAAVVGLTIASLTLLSSSALSSASPALVRSGSQASVNLTVWLNGACFQPCPDTALAKAYEKGHPGVTIKVVAEPTGNFYQALLAASISRTGPDIAQLWPGGYWSTVAKYLVNLRSDLTVARLKQSPTSQYFAVNSDLNGDVIAAPEIAGVYMAFYNKALFAKVGLTSPPTDWAQLDSDAQKLKAAGITPILEGPPPGVAEFGGIQDFSYLASALPIQDWNNLVDGKLSYDNPTLVAQLSKWAELYAKGYINRDALTTHTAQSGFESGKGAMLMNDGSWDIASYYQALGKNLGVFLQPFSVTPQHSFVEVDGTAYGVMSYSRNKTAAEQYTTWMYGPEGQSIIAHEGQPPAIPTYRGTLAPLNATLALASKPGTVVYPQYDTFTQPAVTTALGQYLPEALTGEMTPAAALSAIEKTLQALPASQRDVNYYIGQ
jgi:ABC-type glycerol-3-phosphate transport system substrate-binding protein